MSNQKNKAHRDRKFLDWLRDQPCAVTMAPPPSDPAHTFKSTGGGGMGLKSGDCYAVPLSHAEHDKQGRVGELTYWRIAVAQNDVLLKQMVQAWAEKYYYQEYQRQLTKESLRYV